MNNPVQTALTLPVRGVARDSGRGLQGSRALLFWDERTGLYGRSWTRRRVTFAGSPGKCCSGHSEKLMI